MQISRVVCGIPNHTSFLRKTTALSNHVFRFNGLLGRSGAFWQAETYDHIVRSEEQHAHYRRYIAENPLKAKLREGEYLYVGGSSESREE